MLKELNAQSITQFHDTMLSRADWPHAQVAELLSGTWRWIEANHRYNTLLWNEEDKARRVDVHPAEIAACKRLIDKYNQERNNAIEAMDEAILLALEGCQRHDSARLNSETAGSMIDRLSILSLKILHMRDQTVRDDVDAEHIAACGMKLQRLIAQRQDLASCFDQLLVEASQGCAYFKVYRQFKMYNDPTLNPCLYKKPAQAAAGGASS
jgi:hypothetical protein